MTLSFNNSQELFDWLDEAVEADRTPREYRCRYMASGMLLYEGFQWIVEPTSSRTSSLRRFGQSLDQRNPDRQNLRVTANIITRGIELVESQTFTNEIGFELSPTDFMSDPESVYRTQVMETLLNSGLDAAKFLKAKRVANLRRSVTGVSGLMLSVDFRDREIELNNARITASDRDYRVRVLDPMKLVLDPAVQERDLNDHEYVIYYDAWTLTRIEREYGVKMDKNKAKKMGDLVPLHVELHKLTDGRMFQHYAQYSQTPAALVYQIHWKDSRGVFSNMAVVIDPGDKTDRRWINEENPVSLYGGTGLPMSLYHGVPRSESMWSISDVHKMRDAQHLRNMAESYLMRHLQASSSYKVMMDERGLPNGVTKEAFRQSWDNQIGGVNFYSSSNSTTARPIPAPAIMQMPVLPPAIMELSDRYARDGNDQIHRTDSVRGETKSHVPDATVQSALNRANLPLDKRVAEDIASDADFARMALSTTLHEVRRRNPSTLVVLNRARLDREQIAAILSADPDDPGVEIRVRESAVRARSHESKRADLNTALQSQAISPQQYRMTLASDLDSPVSESDRLHAVAAQEAAMRVASGEEWMPQPLGERAMTYIEAFRDASVSRRATRDPQSKERLMRAIDAQEQFEFARAMALNPEMQMQSQMSAGQAATAQPQPQTVGQLIGGSGGA